MDSNGHPPRLLLNVQETCKTLGIGRSTLYELMASGEIERVQIGRRTLIPQGSLEEYVERLRASA